MIELIKTILTDAGIQLLVPSVIGIATYIASYFKLASVLKQRTKELQRENQKLLDDNKKDSRNWMMDIWEQISEENLRDIEVLKETIRERDIAVEKLSVENRELHGTVIKTNEQLSKTEIENMSLKFYIEIILAFIGDEELLRKKIVEDPHFRGLMRGKDIDKILAEVQTIKGNSKPRKDFKWFKNTGFFYLCLTLDLLQYGKILLSETRKDL